LLLDPSLFSGIYIFNIAEILSMRFLVGLSWFLAFLFLIAGSADSHSGIVDGYGCHRGPNKEGYHCHQGPYAGRAFQSREEFLRQLRNPKSNLPQPKNTPLPLEKTRPSDMEDRNRP
jgi:hypothetical protein